MRVPRLDAATCYTWLGDDEPAEEHAREFIAYHTRLDGSSNAPMGTAINTTVILQVRERKKRERRRFGPSPDYLVPGNVIDLWPAHM